MKVLTQGGVGVGKGITPAPKVLECPRRDEAGTREWSSARRRA